MDIDELVAMGRDEEGEAGKQDKQTPQTEQESLEGEGPPSSEQDRVSSKQAKSSIATIGPITLTQTGLITLPEGWTFPAPDTSGAPLNRVINAAYQQIHGIYEVIQEKKVLCELTPERAAELKARFNAVLQSEKVVNAEEAIEREFRSFQDAVKSNPVDHKAKMQAAGNVRAGCAWLVKYVRWFVWSEEGGGEEGKS